MFPLLAKPNGVLEREGHTEATVDLCRLAGLKACGLCCEIMREDGTMMRTPELMELAKRFGLTFITIKDLQEYRKCHEKLVDREAAVHMPTKYGDFTAYGYVNRLNGEHHVALVKGDIGDGEDVLCRVHSECLTGRHLRLPALRLRPAARRRPDARSKRRAGASCCTCARRAGASASSTS